MKRNILYAAIIFLLASFTAHKYYHSHCTISLDEKSGNGEVVIDLFWHDVEVALTKKKGRPVKIDDKEINTFLKEYLEENFILKNADGKSIAFDYAGSEIKSDEISVYFEYKDLKSFEGLSLTNSLLVREFPTQVNKVNLKKGEWKKSFVYTAKTITQKF